jgi:hypothetical protein
MLASLAFDSGPQITPFCSCCESAQSNVTRIAFGSRPQSMTLSCCDFTPFMARHAALAKDDIGSQDPLYPSKHWSSLMQETFPTVSM